MCRYCSNLKELMDLREVKSVAIINSCKRSIHDYDNLVKDLFAYLREVAPQTVGQPVYDRLYQRFLLLLSRVMMKGR